ncbi:hypothetical protein ACFT7S_03105 [Streptomyces sp. NPDC057136]|uniref:hypothetical protein n=1 Tax=Streptomyces sp. NPDC057136 TaxID=3346029 RepID=UPI00362F6127
MLFWHVPAPNEAMLISGTKRQAQETQFRIVTGHGSFVLPVKQKARMLSLALREAEISEDCVTQQGKADQEATEREQQAAALKAEYERDTAIKRAGFLAETEQSNARAAQAGPLAQARASHEVIEEQTALAERQAMLAAQRLEAEVRRPADAEAYRQRTLAEAARDQVKFEADGNAYAARTLAQAQADANAARAASLRDGNQELIAANLVVENLPALADAAARGMSGASLTVLNGTDGVNEIAAGLVGQGLAILNSLQNTKNPAVNGKSDLRLPGMTS